MLPDEFDEKHRTPVFHNYTARWYGERNGEVPRVIVVHDTETGMRSAKAVASFFSTRPDKVSAHIVVDNTSLYDILDPSKAAWTAPGANHDGLQIEICGFASYTKEQWYQQQASLKRAAWYAAKWCYRYSIPVRWLTNDQLKGGEAKGLVTHAQVSRVFKLSDHTDPGRNFPRGYFADLIRKRLLYINERQ